MQILRASSGARELWLCAILVPLLLLSCVRRDEYALFQLALMEDRGRVELALSEYVVHEDPEIRQAVATTIGRVGDSSHLRFLEVLVEDDNPRVREKAAFACGLLKSRSAIPFLTAHLQDNDDQLRARTVEALGRVGGEKLGEKVNPLLNDPAEEVRCKAALALWRLDDREAVPELIAALNGAGGEFLYSLSYALMRLATPECFETFQALLEQSDPEVRANAARGLGNLKEPRALPILQRSLRDPDRRVIVEAVRALEKVGDKTAADALLELLSTSRDENLLSETIKVLGNLGDKRASERLSRFLTSDSEILRGEALVALAKLKREGALEDLKELLKDESWYVRAKVAEGLAQLHGAEVERVLLVMTADRDRRVQMASLEAMGEAIDQKRIPGHRALKKLESILIESMDFALRSVCAEALAKTKDPRYIYPLIKSYKFTPRSNYSDLKRSIISSLVKLTTADHVDVRIQNLLLEALADRDPIVRREAHEAAKELSMDHKYDACVFQSKLTFGSYFQIYRNHDELLRARILTPKGEIIIELMPQYAPRTVANFIHLTNSGFYNRRIFHRVVPNFVIQDGCPRGDGWGGPGYSIREEINELEFHRGTIGMATSGKDTGGSQFFICHSSQPNLNGRYTAFGRVVSGMDVIDEIVVGDLIEKVEILTSRF
jgi:HEAT repeat protein